MHQLKEMLKCSGIYSACTSNDFVINAVIKSASYNNTFALIEATSNAVNQFGGYSGLNPFDFVDYIKNIADDYSFDYKNLIIGGDHLGPLPFKQENANTAMEMASDLIATSVKAGYRKIHLDTTMPLLDDPAPLDYSTIAKRSATLAKVVMHSRADDQDIVLVLGGNTTPSDRTRVITQTDIERLFSSYLIEFEKQGLSFENVIGIACPVGIGYSDLEIIRYNHSLTKDLTVFLNRINGISIEAHATDYQTREDLFQMVQDGIKILKVGPSLTYRLIQVLASLSIIESKMADIGQYTPSNFSLVLEHEMRKNPKHYADYYFGSDDELQNKINHSYKNRSRYYLSNSAVESAINQLILNISTITLPDELIITHLPTLAKKILSGEIPRSAFDIILAYLEQTIFDYLFATGIVK